MAGPGTLPTAAAVAAAAVTAKITAMDAQEQIKSLVRLCRSLHLPSKIIPLYIRNSIMCDNVQ
jgi:hypothetical protein